MAIQPLDGGWGWVIVACAFILHVIADGIMYSFGVLFVALLEDFQASKGDTAWILSIFVGTTLATGPVASILVNLYGCQIVTIAGAIIGAIGFVISPFAPQLWFLYLSFGFVAGFGFGLTYLPAKVSVNYYFDKKRSLATGLACCGSGFGTFIFAPLMTVLVDEYGWKQSCYWLAGIILQCCIFGALLRPPPSIENTDHISPEEPNISIQITDSQIVKYSPCDVKTIPEQAQLSSSRTSLEQIVMKNSLEKQVSQTTDKKKSSTNIVKLLIDFSLLKNWSFLLFLVSNFFTSFGYNAPFLFIPDRALSFDMNKHQASMLVSIVGIANTVGRILFGFMADLKWIKPHRIHLYNTGLLIAGVATCFSYSETYGGQIVYVTIFGLLMGSYVSLTAIVLVDLLGVDRLSSSFGVTLLVQGVAVLIGPPACGWIYDATDTYLWPFVVTGGCIAISGAILYFLPLVSRLQYGGKRRQADIDMDARIEIGKITEVGDEDQALKTVSSDS